MDNNETECPACKKFLVDRQCKTLLTIDYIIDEIVIIHLIPELFSGIFKDKKIKKRKEIGDIYMSTINNKESKKETLSPSEANLIESGNFCIDFHGAAIIDDNGQEIAITEAMIKTACNKLISDQSLTPYL